MSDKTMCATIVASPMSGAVADLDSVSDPAFSAKMMGEGVAIAPSVGMVVAPFDCVVDTVAETGHAIGLRSAQGIELLIHIGIETVNLKGRFFTMRAREGQRLAKGEPLIEFDLEAIVAAGYEILSPVTVINASDYGAVRALAKGSVAAGDSLLEIQEK